MDYVQLCSLVPKFMVNCKSQLSRFFFPTENFKNLGFVSSGISMLKSLERSGGSSRGEVAQAFKESVIKEGPWEEEGDADNMWMEMATCIGVWSVKGK
jgi:hypothetical protein